MCIEWRKSPSGQEVLHVSGTLDFSRRNEFMGKLEQHKADRGSPFFDLDLSGVTHLDTAGLGLLLILLDRLKAADQDICLLNCSPVAKQYLSFANFDRRFLIS
jgi:anti-anti-sigma factor